MVMPRFEEKLIYDKAVKPFAENIQLYLRFIEDIFLIYLDQVSVPAFVQWLNLLHDSIKLTSKWDDELFI